MLNSSSLVRPLSFAVLSACALSLGGCATKDPRPFAGREPRLDPEKYFEGRTRSWGIVEDRFGKVRREFTQDLMGRRENGGVRLDQTFTYSDGKIEKRNWLIRKVGEHRYTGVANDGVGEGEAYGNAFRWTYTLKVPIGNLATKVHFDQLMLRQPDNVLINTCTFSKFGVRLGTVSEFFRKSPASSRPPRGR